MTIVRIKSECWDVEVYPRGKNRPDLLKVDDQVFIGDMDNDVSRREGGGACNCDISERCRYIDCRLPCPWNDGTASAGWRRIKDPIHADLLIVEELSNGSKNNKERDNTA